MSLLVPSYDEWKATEDAQSTADTEPGGLFCAACDQCGGPCSPDYLFCSDECEDERRDEEAKGREIDHQIDLDLEERFASSELDETAEHKAVTT